MTDRGQALILLGSPWQVGGRGPESRAPGARETPTMQDIDAVAGSCRSGPRGVGDPDLDLCSRQPGRRS